MENNYFFKARLAWWQLLNNIKDDAAGRICKALWLFAETGERSNLANEYENATLQMFISEIDKDLLHEKDVSLKRAAAGSKGGKQKVANLAIANNKSKKKELDIEQESEAEVSVQLQQPNAQKGSDVLYFENNIAPMTDKQLKELDDIKNQLGSEADKLVIHAVDSACDRQKEARNWNYVKAILKAYIDDGIKTIEQASKRDNDWQDKNSVFNCSPDRAESGQYYEEW